MSASNAYDWLAIPEQYANQPAISYEQLMAERTAAIQAELKADREAELIELHYAQVKERSTLRRSALKLDHTNPNGVPTKLLHASFKCYVPTCAEAAKVKASVMQFSKNVVGNFILSGSTGTGKTHMAVATLNAIYQAGQEALYVECATVLSLIKGNWTTRQFAEDDLLNLFGETFFLVLDEVGASGFSDKDREIINTIISHRYNKNLSTLLISNQSVRVFPEILGDRVYSRLLEHCSVSECAWGDYRLSKNNGVIR